MGDPRRDLRRWWEHQSCVQAVGVPCEDPRSPPPVLCPSHGCCWAHFFPKILVWKSSSLLWVHPKGGWLGAAPCGCRIWGQQPSPSWQSHPMWLWGEKRAFRENSSFPDVGLAPMPGGWAHVPVGYRGLMAVPAPPQGLGRLGWHRPPAQPRRCHPSRHPSVTPCH